MQCYPNRIKTHLENHLTNRLDLTDKNVFSIDGDSTLDVDDAIHYENTGDKQIIGIHIADVVNMFSHIRDIEKHQFVTQLMENVSSIYPGGGKVDMINKDAGENLCSLNEGEPRNVVSLLLEFEPTKPNKLLSAKIHLSKIINRHKMTYKEMDKIIEMKRRHVLQQDILQIRDIIDANENLPATMEMDEYKEEGEHHSRAIIAKLMATYNTIMAKKLFDGNKNSILRVHYGASIPDEPEGGTSGNKEIDKLLERMATFKGYYVVSRQTNEAEIEHRGLGLKYYTHMSSPIRRFVDFWNQLCMYEILGKLEGETTKYKIEERISFLNWKQMQIKKSYELLDMVHIFHKKMDGELESQYTGYILGWGENNQISVFIPDMDKKVLKFCINLEKLENILERKEDESRLIWKRKDNNNIFIFEKYMKIMCRIILQKNRYEWQNKVGIELIEPNFSDFLMN
jgi:exoribonuclease R